MISLQIIWTCKQCYPKTFKSCKKTYNQISKQETKQGHKSIVTVTLMHTFLESTVRISNLSCQDGKSQNRRRSNLPGLKSAASSKSGLLLDMRCKHQKYKKLIFISHLFSFCISKNRRKKQTSSELQIYHSLDIFSILCN